MCSLRDMVSETKSSQALGNSSGILFMTRGKEPETLQEAVLYFADPDNRVEYVSSRRRPNGVTCPICGSAEARYYKSVRRWECKNQHPKRQFSVKNGTIFEESPISLDKWLVAMWLLVNCKNGVSSYEIHRAIKVTQKTAWFMMHRVRRATEQGSFGKLSGEIEADE